MALAKMKLLLTCLAVFTAALVAKGDHVLCSNLLTHGPSTPSPEGNGGFYIVSTALDQPLGYGIGISYSVFLVGQRAFTEFTVVAQDGAEAAQGNWLVLDMAKSTTTDCNATVPESAAVTSLSNAAVVQEEFLWTAPSTDVGPITFIYSVVGENGTTYIGLNATANRPPFQSLASIPEGCQPEECDYHAAWRQNNDIDFADFLLQGKVQGWLALGLSEDQLMGGDDVLACQLDSNGTVNVKDTFNIQDRTNRNNFIDDPNVEDHDLASQGILNVETANTDGRISCSFTRQKSQSNALQDQDLNQPSYLLFGLDPDDTAGASDHLSYHNSITPIVSTEQVTFVLNGTFTDLVPAARTGTIFPPPALPRLGSYRQPEGCVGDACNYLAEWFMDGSDNIVFRMTAATSGWVAIGLSGDNRMSGAEFDDVIACQAEVGGASVNAKDMINPTGARANALDTDQSGTTLVEGEVSNGRISCSVRRAISTGDTSQDRPLNQAAFFLFAYGSAQGGTSDILNYHGVANRFVSGSPQAATASGDATEASDPTQPYIQAHGILMIWAWVFLAATGIFYARYTRPAFVTGQWFEVHRAFLTASVVLTDISFIVIFVGLQGFLEFGAVNPLGSAHFIIGVIVVTFQIYNPIIAAFRCPPGAKLRPIFDVIHGILVGTVVELLSFVNCALGVWLFALRTQRTAPFYLIVVTLIILIAFEVGMGIYHFVAKYIVSSLSSAPEESKKTEVEMRELETPEPDKKDSKSAPPPKKVPSKDAKFRMLMGIIYPAVIFLFLLLITVLIAVGQY
uniref:Ferric-chelate reductase 1 n=1 Tax=Halisarca dujardinii TaxID=2583056 RepID=A0A6C0PMZ4_HALDU|nr:ferric-chelate reductase 1 [Halisarca dujardinii]